MSRERPRYHNDWDEDERRQYRQPPRYRQSPRKRPKRRVWPWLLTGCAGGILILVIAAVIIVLVAVRSATNSGSIPSIPGITNQANYTKQSQQTLQITSLTQLQIHNQVGNVIVATDPSATNTTITTLKKVKAASSDDANKEFNNISVQVQSPTAPTSPLTINATVPGTGSIFGSHTDSVDINITLPASAISSASAAFTLNVTNSIGNISVSGLKGILQLKDDIGDITVQQATLFDSSHLLTGTGNVTFNGSLDTTPLSNGSPPRYKIQSETGSVNATLPGDTNVILDANTNYGSITGDFPINATPTDKAANYYGPLNPNSSSGTPVAVLTLNVSTGSVTVHRA
ncbi:MAG: DUF4097 domain-containing protein [Chloroflexi bacterium]|nr:MAG: DUF4097 domain-containing protein [Chloroflexota bacterium]